MFFSSPYLGFVTRNNIFMGRTGTFHLNEVPVLRARGKAHTATCAFVPQSTVPLGGLGSHFHKVRVKLSCEQQRSGFQAESRRSGYVLLIIFSKACYMYPLKIFHCLFDILVVITAPNNSSLTKDRGNSYLLQVKASQKVRDSKSMRNKRP